MYIHTTYKRVASARYWVKFLGILPESAMQTHPRAVGQTPNASEDCWDSSCIAKKWEKLEKGRRAVRCSASLVHMFVLTSRLVLDGELAK
jgi:hypothetical protein